MNRKIKAIVITLLLTLGLSNTYAAAAGAGHSHVVSQERIENNAQKALIKYVKSEKIPITWVDASLLSSKKIGEEWIITFFNDKTIDKSKQKLDFYLTSYGKVKGANFKK